MKLNFKLVLLATAFTLSSVAQETKMQNLINNRGCATNSPGEEWDAWFNQKVEEYKQAQQTGKVKATTYVIPVVVHVIHGNQNVGTFPNISQAQINSQISVLNADFAGNGLNVNQLSVTAFSAVGAANCDISFCLAEKDPQGNALVEPGIDRINYVTKGWTNPASFATQATFQNYMDATIKPNTVWDATRYFNIWITDANANIGILGYATFPAGSGLVGLSGFGNGNTDGIWVWSRAFGNVGTLQAPYNRGRTATHEAGHWLGLRHIGGDGNGNPNGDCNATDYCNDTPPQKGGFSGGQYGQNFGAPTYPLNAGICSPNGDMFMNFMDYTDDASNYMFTPDQKTRFMAAMANGSYRKFLTASSATLCGNSASVPQAAFSMTTEICRDSLMQVTNQTTGMPGSTYVWSSNPSGGITFTPSPNVANPKIIFTSPGVYSISVAATNTVGTNSITHTIQVYDCSDEVGVINNAWFDQHVLMMPNPANETIQINTNINSEALSVSIINMLGQIIVQKNTASKNMELNVADIPEGVYIVKISDGKNVTEKRLIVKH